MPQLYNFVPGCGEKQVRYQILVLMASPNPPSQRWMFLFVYLFVCSGVTPVSTQLLLLAGPGTICDAGI